MLGVCYYPEHWPEAWWPDDARRMREVGISYVRIAEFAWSRIEPEPGRFEWDWLDRAIDCLHAHGLKVVMCTPTATPPKWLVDAYPDILPVDAEGRVRGFGSRRHTTFSSKTWWRESERITLEVARRYGQHPGVAGWQTDNEYGCHDTILSYAPVDLVAFQGWLRRRYQSPEALNAAWGNVFWSMEVNSFAEISLPNLAVTETNPAAKLDFWRFHSEQVAAYDKMQVDILRAHSPGRFVTHNFMGLFHDFDHFAVGDHLDLATWDSYPIGFTERFPFPLDEKLRFAETAHPDMAPFHHDLYRAVGKGRWWVMEQQPGPVNWAPWNPVPRPGQIRLFTWEALAHGAEVVSYFRWRQAPFAQEQMHAGLNRPDRTLSQGGLEARQVGRELAMLGPLPETHKAEVAFLFDYESSWITRIQPQGQDFDYAELTYRWYEAIRRLGLDVDFVRPGGDLTGYKLIVVPTMLHASDAAVTALETATGAILFGPRVGSKTRTYQIPAALPPGPLAGLMPARVLQVASLRPGLEKPVDGRFQGTVTRWRDHIDASNGTVVEARFADGGPAVLAHGRHRLIAGWPDARLLTAVLTALCADVGITTTPVPEAIRLRRRGAWTFAFNYGDTPWAVPDGAHMILGDRVVAPSDLAIYQLA
jgi:beta-galactosidase